jgi:hypothetical protein
MFRKAIILPIFAALIQIMVFASVSNSIINPILAQQNEYSFIKKWGSEGVGFGKFADLKYGDKVRAVEIAEAQKNFQHANPLRKQLIKIQDTESEISAQIQN